MKLDKYKEAFKKAELFVDGDLIVNSRGDVLGGLDPYGHIWFRDEMVGEIIRKVDIEPVMKVKEVAPKKRKPQKIKVKKVD